MIERDFLIACQNNDIKSFNKLIKQVDIDCQDARGMTGLMLAVCDEYLLVVETLIKFGADLNIKNDDGMTALMFAAGRSNINIFNCLIENGADIEITNNRGVTAYTIAEECNLIPIMHFFAHEIITQKDSNGNTLLMKACQQINEVNSLFLYENGADFYHKNNKGLTPYDILMNHDRLPARLQALKEKLILEKEIDEDDDSQMINSSTL